MHRKVFEMTTMNKQVDVIQMTSTFAFDLLSRWLTYIKTKKSSSYVHAIVTKASNCCTLFIHLSQTSVCYANARLGASRLKFQIVATDTALELLLQSHFLRSHHDLFALNNTFSYFFFLHCDATGARTSCNHEAISRTQ